MPNIRAFRKLDECALQAIANEIRNTDWSILDSIVDVSIRWCVFKSILKRIIDSIAPLKKTNKIRKKSVPWYDAELHRKQKLVSSLFSKFKTSHSKIDDEAFKKARNEYQWLFRKKRIDYYSKKTAGSFTSSKNFWEFYASSVRLKKDPSSHKTLSSITINGKTLSDTKEIASGINKYFTSLGNAQNLKSDAECSSFINRVFKNDERLERNRQNSQSEFSFRHTSHTILEKLISQLDTSSSPGVTEIATKILKSSSSAIAPFLARLFNSCIDKSALPDEFKQAIVTPLYKNKGNADDINNYRGISVLPPIAKVFEKLLAEQARIYFEVNKLFFSGQHGFRTSHSCESALHELMSKALSNMDKKLINLMLFVDFKKAFDMVDPKLLLVKLLNYGFANSAIFMLRNYFADRKQQVKINEVRSDFVPIELGVPQGSVLGPFLFLVFINDLPSFLSSVYTKIFADDTTLLFESNTIEQCIVESKKEINLLTDWCDHNRLFINWDKTFIMFITNKRVTKPKVVKINNHEVKVVDDFRLLGITLDSKLAFTKHVSLLSLSINRKMFAIKRIYYLSQDVRVTFFKTFILPCFDFGLSLVIYFSKTALNKLVKVFYKCIFHLLRIDCSGMSYEQVDAALKLLRLQSLQGRIFLKLASFGFQMKHSPLAPEELKSQLAFSPATHNYHLRSVSRNCVRAENVTTSHGNRQFKNFYAKLLNRHNEINDLFNKFTFSTMISFKRQLYASYIESLKKFISIFEFFSTKITVNVFQRRYFKN